MNRSVLLCGLISLVMAFSGTAAAILLVRPSISEAQQRTLRADELIVVGDNGADRIRLQTGPGAAARVHVLDLNGAPRAGFATGGAQGTAPEGAGFQLFASDGVQVMRLGVGNPQDDGRTNLMFLDRESRPRLLLAVETDGTPTISLLDADGSVSWSAPSGR